jgi:fluoride exporter
MKVLLVGFGGFLGSMLRYWLSGFAQDACPGVVFPVGTLVVNALGCLAIGLISELAEARGATSPETRAFLVVGLLGGFTTFSAFANETVSAFRDGDRVVALANVALSVAVCLVAVWGGRAIASLLWR